MKLYRPLIIILIIGTIVLISGCFGVKNISSDSGMHLYDTFFVGEDGVQYFIKPLSFNDKNKNKLIIDFTFRYKDEIKDSAFINISFINKEIVRNIDSIKIYNNSTSIVLKRFKYMFSERAQKEFNSRYSSKGSLKIIYNLFNNSNWTIIVFKNINHDLYDTSDNTKNKIYKLKHDMFKLFTY